MSTPTWRRLQHLGSRKVTARAALGACAVLLAAAGGILWAVQGPTPVRTPSATSTTTTPSTSTRSHQSTSTTTPSTTSPPSTGAPSTVLPALGVYVGPGAATSATAVNQELGGKVTYVLDYLSATSWATITEPTWLAAAWHGTPFRLVIGVPMLPEATQTGLAQGATGAYDGNFATLAQRLVADGLGDATLMVGWQPADPTNPWSVTTAAEAAAYVSYWDDIESTMAGVTGAHFTFLWDVGDPGSKPAVSPTAMYPGDAAVDVVATDAFDTAPSTLAATAQWPHVLDLPDGPAWLASFAAAHHKPMAIAMWGESPTANGGDGDVAQFVSGLLHWASSAGVQMTTMWDYGAATITGGGFPNALGAVEKALGPATTSVASPARAWDASQTRVGRPARNLVAEASRKRAARRGEPTVLRSLGSA